MGNMFLKMINISILSLLTIIGKHFIPNLAPQAKGKKAEEAQDFHSISTFYSFIVSLTPQAKDKKFNSIN